MSLTYLDKSLSEEDIKSRYIQPALEEGGWLKNRMRLEYAYTAGQIVVQGKIKHRKKGKRVDYLLYDDDNYPIAVVEAKDFNHTPDDGLQQAMGYAQDLDLKFAYSSNGDKFVEHDFFTGKERTFDMDEFPSPAELHERYRQGESITEAEESLLKVPYHSDSNSFEPRYYQRIAINRTIQAIAKGQQRVLLVMATGTGKTYTAMQIIHRLRKSGLKKNILFLADRNILIDQTMMHDFKPFQKFMTKIKGKTLENGPELYMSLYTQWVKNEKDLKEGEKQPYEEIDKDFFDLIVVDECHRSSINEDKEWHMILEHFSSATQIGMTATPKSADGADNIAYFGEPVFTYSLIDGINDGFLAPYHVTQSFLDIDLEGYEPLAGEKDLLGNPIYEEVFTRNNYGKDINIRNRQILVAERITSMLHDLGGMTKTIVFCPDEEEALIMRDLLVSMNQKRVKRHPDYCVRITASERNKSTYLDNFIDPYSTTPVIATTSQLLSTGVDCKTCGLIVIDKEVSSMTTFKQMIGRGTRIFEEKKKMSFEILDFRNVTSKFFDKKFDMITDSTSTYSGRKNKDEQEEEAMPKPEEPKQEHTKYYVKGKEVKIVHERVMHIGPDGRTLMTEKLTDFTRKAIKESFPTLEDFRGKWQQADKKAEILELLEGNDVLLDAIREENPALKDCDDYDIICHVAFDVKPLTRRERIEGVKKRNYLAKYQGKALEVIEALMDKYGEVGIKEIENNTILNLSPFTKIAARPRIINGVFRGVKDYNKVIAELEDELYYMEA